jgi:hypothetical protein
MPRSPRLGPLFGVSLAVIASAVAITGLAASPSYASTASAESVIQGARTAIAKEPGVHVAFVVANTDPSSIAERITADIGASSGTERVSAGKESLTVRLTPSDVYVSGNSSGLTSILGLSSAQARKVGKDWVFWKKGTSQYSSLQSNVTISSVKAILPKAKGTKVSTEVAGGAKLYVLRWKTPATSSAPTLSNTLTISYAGTNLPSEATTTDSSGTKVTTTFSKWGESIAVDVPPAASTMNSSRLKG